MLISLAILTALSNQARSLDVHPQEPLLSSTKSSNFIQQSIFGRLDVDSASLADPVSLPPVHRRVGYEDDYTYEGISTFAHLPYVDCVSKSANNTFDIGIVGHPFDLGVTYRPGARFGPNGARQGARRMNAATGYE
jgi:agmatinase